MIMAVKTDNEAAINYYNNYGYVIFSNCISKDKCEKLRNSRTNLMVPTNLYCLPTIDHPLTLFRGQERGGIRILYIKSLFIIYIYIYI